MRAKFKGYCRRGGHAIRVGDEIGRDGLRGWAHGPCLMNKLDPPPPVQDEADYFAEWRGGDRDNAEYAAGVEDANRYKFNRDFMGQAYADAEEYARDLRGLNGDW